MKAFAVFLLAATTALAGDHLSGLWDATVAVAGVQVPFRFELSGEAAITAAFFNGTEKVPSTSGSFAEGRLVLEFSYFGTKLEAAWKDGAIEGQYGRPGRSYPFKAVRHVASAAPGKAPSIEGVWEIPTNSAKGESAWRLIVRQSGGEVSAGILRVDGDTGTLTGGYHEGRFVLSHFSGARPLLLEITPTADGTLELVQNARTRYTAIRPSDARERGLAPPTDPSLHTSIKDPAEPFRFAAKDLGGKSVSERDFLGKVVLLNITGSWCPNCHDEAPFLAELYRRYRDRGLVVVGLSFEEAEQLADPVRLRSFVVRYGIEYPVLLAGEPSSLAEKLPQAVNLNSWPTSFLLGRDGRVRAVHAGFPSSASGKFFAHAKEEITSTVERLLAEGKQ